MKKIYIVIILLLIIIYILIPSPSTKKVKNKPISEVRGIFISYMELNTYILDKDKTTSIKNIDNMINNISKDKFNTIYLQVRSYADSIYKSNVFPTSKSIILKDGTFYDVLELFLKKAKVKNIKVYAWINPYRVGYNIDYDSNYYKKVGNDIKQVGNMYYFNPSSKNVENLIVDGVVEIIKKYKIDGVIFDDYFYPSNDIDLDDFKSSNNSNINDYHLNVINNMVERVYKSIKKINKNILFGISPDGNIENNYNKNFADVKKWCSSNNYIDFIMPQVYYGFNNTTKPYQSVINEWSSIITNKKISLIYALAFYKVGNIDEYAKDGKYEWINSNNIIKNQVQEARKINNYNGFSIFRYDNLFNKDKYTKNTINEKNGLKSIM